MIRNIYKHFDFINQKLSDNDKKLNLDRLQIYNRQRIQDFQHERLIHLIVTMTIGLSLVIFSGFILAFQLVILLVPLALLFLLFIPYIFHYYQLENGVQKLYKLTELIEEKLKQKNID
jgi:hypothetical protein